MGQHAYAVTNKLTGLAASAFTWSNSYAGTDRNLVCDGRMDKRVNIGSATFPISVVIDLGSAQAIAGAAILNHNVMTLHQGAVHASVEGADDSGMSVNRVTTKDSTELAQYLSFNTREPMNKDHVLQFTSTSKRYWRITLDEEAGPTTLNNVSFGEIWLYATPTQLSRKGIYGSGDSAELFTSELQFDNGESRGVFFGGPVRQKVLRWADFSATDRDNLRKLFYATQGNAGRLLFIDSYETGSTAAANTEQDVIFGRLEALESLPYNEVDYSLYQLPDFKLRSLGREVGA